MRTRLPRADTPSRPTERLDKFEKFGHRVGQYDRAFTRLAIMAAYAGASGEIIPYDAPDVLKAFRDARRRGAGLPPEAPDEYTKSDIAQASKLAKCIEVGQRFGKAGMRMLERASKIHIENLSQTDPKKLRYRGEYNALVEVARAALRERRVLNDLEILKALVVTK